LTKNKYKIDGNDVIVYLDRKDGSIVETIIEFADFDKVLNYKYKWYAKHNINTDSFYVYATIYNNLLGRNSTIKLSKYILDYKGNQEVDHKDHDTLNNRRSNLRVALFSDNSKHRKGKNSNNKTGYRNVSFINGWYVVQLQIEGQNKIIGKFKDLDEAGGFAKIMREKYYGDFSGEN